MSAESPAPSTNAPELLNVTLKFPDVQTFVERFASFLERTRILLPGVAARPLGTRIRFQLKLKDNTSLIGGTGHVEAIVTPGLIAGCPPGMVLTFAPDETSRKLCDRILGARGDGRSPMLPQPSGVPPLPVPAAAASSAPAATARVAAPAATSPSAGVEATAPHSSDEGVPEKPLAMSSKPSLSSPTPPVSRASGSAAGPPTPVAGTARPSLFDGRTLPNPSGRLITVDVPAVARAALGLPGLPAPRPTVGAGSASKPPPAPIASWQMKKVSDASRGDEQAGAKSATDEQEALGAAWATAPLAAAPPVEGSPLPAATKTAPAKSGSLSLGKSSGLPPLGRSGAKPPSPPPGASKELSKSAPTVEKVVSTDAASDQTRKFFGSPSETSAEHGAVAEAAAPVGAVDAEPVRRTKTPAHGVMVLGRTQLRAQSGVAVEKKSDAAAGLRQTTLGVGHPGTQRSSSPTMGVTIVRAEKRERSDELERAEMAAIAEAQEAAKAYEAELAQHAQVAARSSDSVSSDAGEDAEAQKTVIQWAPTAPPTVAAVEIPAPAVAPTSAAATESHVETQLLVSDAPAVAPAVDLDTHGIRPLQTAPVSDASATSAEPPAEDGLFTAAPAPDADLDTGGLFDDEDSTIHKNQASLFAAALLASDPRARLHPPGPAPVVPDPRPTSTTAESSELSHEAAGSSPPSVVAKPEGEASPPGLAAAARKAGGTPVSLPPIGRTSGPMRSASGTSTSTSPVEKTPAETSTPVRTPAAKPAVLRKPPSPPSVIVAPRPGDADALTPSSVRPVMHSAPTRRMETIERPVRAHTPTSVSTSVSVAPGILDGPTTGRVALISVVVLSIALALGVWIGAYVP